MKALSREHVAPLSGAWSVFRRFVHFTDFMSIFDIVTSPSYNKPGINRKNVAASVNSVV